MALKRILSQHRAGALRSPVKLDFNRLVDDRYVSPMLPKIVRAPVKGARGDSGSPSTVDPDA